MEKYTLVVNIGSSSKKYSLYNGEKLLAGVYFEKDKEKFDVTYEGEETKEISLDDFTNSLSSFFETLKNKEVICDASTIQAVGVRLVAPGEYFTENHIIDDIFLEKLSIAVEQDPIHIKPIQAELSRIKELLNGVKLVAISDSAFHKDMPRLAREYAIPKELIKEEGLYRFGYHGISLSAIVNKLSNRPWGLENRVIICHLGSGASMTAVLNGKSIDTSMGYSPLEGLVMSSRVGNIDVGAVLQLAQKRNVDELEKLFYTESGLLALSGLSNDMRVLLDNEKEGHEGAHFAVETFIYTILKYIGMYASVLGGVDAIVFSGTIGERSFILRGRICEKLGWLNVHIDGEKNIHAKNGDKISNEGSVNVYVEHSDEDFEIMKETQVFLS